MERGKLWGLGALALAAVYAGRKLMHDPSTPPGLAASEPLIARLHPSIQNRARELLARAWALGVPLVVTSGLRPNEEQARLYAQGRTAPGAIVTNSPPGSSWHNFGLAFDVAPLKPDGSGRPYWPEDDALWTRVGQAGEAAGLTWGGRFTTIKDRPHFEYHPGLSLALARAGQRPDV